MTGRTQQYCISRNLSIYALYLLLAGCGGNGEIAVTPTPTPTPTPSAAPTFAEKCAGLQGKTVATAEIALPTTGATIGDAQVIAATATAPEYCQVRGAIAPVDRFAPAINFQLNLPSSWNQKAVHFGGGGANGVVITGLGNMPGSANSGTPIPTPLARGYATFGSDSGHVGSDYSFGLNEEAYLNFGGDQLRKTLDTAQSIIKTFYGSAPKRQYFAGGSQGGKEAFIAIQRWPAKYDGIVAYYPATNLVAQSVGQVYQVQAIFNTPGAWINPTKLALVESRVIQTCDPLDGVQDGLISNVAACASTFDFAPLRCPSGGDDGNTCLSDVQISVLRKVSTRTTLPFALDAGVNSAPGRPTYSGGSSGLYLYGSSGSYQDLGLGGIIRNFVTKDQSQTPTNHNPMTWAAGWLRHSVATDASTADLTGFRNRGGKIIWVHGLADSAYLGQASADYYERLRSFFGDTALRAFVRMYLVPGYDHGNGAFNVSFDSLPVLEKWVENGEAPAADALVAADGAAATRGRTRPLCDYPKWPRYRGTGDVNLAASYQCVP